MSTTEFAYWISLARNFDLMDTLLEDLFSGDYSLSFIHDVIRQVMSTKIVADKYSELLNKPKLTEVIK